jgi:Tol biopolymer transport system component
LRPQPAEQPVEALVPAPEPEPPVVIDAEVAPADAPPRHWRRLWVGSLVASALIGAALAPIVRDHAFKQAAQPETAPTALSAPAAPAEPGPASVAPPSAAAPAHLDATRVDTAAHPSGAGAADAGALEPAHALAEPASFSPSFSNTGTAMFFHENEDGGGTALVRADTSSRGEILKITRIVDDSAQNFHVRPSPDGAHIAFDSDREGMRAVFVADANGHNVRRVSGEGFAAVPSWSPDGAQLAFVKAEADDPRVWNLWTADLGSGELKRVTSYKVGQPWGGSWFPDGSRLAYSHETELVVLNLETGARRVYQTPIKGRLVRTPAVSPDGRRIIFQVYHDGAWLLDLRNGSMRRVLDDPTAEEYTWSPDGHRVAFHSRKAGGWGVWVMGQ